jgi:hypothetical protein
MNLKISMIYPTAWKAQYEILYPSKPQFKLFRLTSSLKLEDFATAHMI